MAKRQGVLGNFFLKKSKGELLFTAQLFNNIYFPDMEANRVRNLHFKRK